MKKLEVLFRNKTRYSEKEYEIFLKSYSDEYTFSETLYSLTNIFFFGMCLIVAIKYKEIFLSIALAVGLIVYIWYKFIRPIFKIKENKQNTIKANYMNTFYFYKSYFRVENEEGTANIRYMGIYKVIEEEEYFYIYITRDNAFIISKDGFIDSTSYDFSNFIRKKVWGKYKNKMKKNR